MNARTVRSAIAILAVAAVPSLGFVAPAAHADTTCGDVCSIGGSAHTPLGLVTVTTGPGNVATVRLEPTDSRTAVFGIPFAIPPGPPAIPGYARTTIDAGPAGTVTVDTFVVTPGLRSFRGLSDVAVISIHPPSPCRAATTGDTVVFTPTS